MILTEKKDLAEIAEMIASRRKELCMSQSDVAKISGVDQATISYMESGKRIPTLMNLASVLGSLGMVIKIEKNT